MIKHGEAPFMECSTRGRKQFSAFYARPKSLNGRSIEEAYQAMKIFEDGSTNLTWKEAKGKKAINAEECAAMYKKWWQEYITENNLLSVLQQASGLSDMFGQKGHVCQATVLWEIRNGPQAKTR